MSTSNRSDRPALAARATARRTGARVLVPTLLALAVSAAFAQNGNEVLLNAGTLVTDSGELAASRNQAPQFSGKGLHLLQFAGPIQPGDREGLEAEGLTVVTYIPMYAYLVYGEAAAIARVQAGAQRAGSRIAWDGAWLDAYKLAPSVWSGADAEKLPLAARIVAGDRFEVQLVADPAVNAETLALLADLGGSVSADPGALPGYRNLVVTLPGASLLAFAARPEVVSIHRYVEPRRNDERQAMIVAGQISGTGPAVGNYLDRMTAWGFTQGQFNTSGFIVDVTDDGADRGSEGPDPGTCLNNANSGLVQPRHFVLREAGTFTGASRFAYKGPWGAATGADACLGRSGHGQLNMSIVGGFVPNALDPSGTRVHRDTQGFRYGLGIAPFVRLANSVIFNPGFTSPNIPNMLSAGYASGARISSNSWGAAVGGAYNANAQTYDGLVRDAQAGTAGNQPMTLLFAAGNSGPGANTTGSPATAKNVITVGASENVHSHAAANGGPAGNTTGVDRCGVTDTGADNLNDIIGFSSRGPTDDGRIKPDLVAPGTHVTGMSFVIPGQDPTTLPNWFLGAADASYRADGVCAFTGAGAGSALNFFPTIPAQRWYTTSSGTSHSTPAVAGAAALVYQQFINNPGYIAANRVPAGPAPPSPALLKGFLMNTAGYLNGVSANDTLPSNSQGMGIVNLNGAFGPAPRIVRDQVVADRFTASGQTRSFPVTVVDGANPVRVTLAYTDVAGPTAGNAFVNDLDLRLVIGGQTYRGNVFSGANSVTGGTADPRNNVESVFLPAGLGGNGVITVTATNIAGQADPTVAGNNQDFALVGFNLNPAANTPVLAIDSVATAPSATTLQPNTCNTVTATVSNQGTGSATAVTGAISTTSPGVQIAIGSAAFPNLAAGASAVNATPLTFSVLPGVACGSEVTVSFSGSSSAGPFGPQATSYRVGTPVFVATELFDAVTAPALPAGWTAAVTGTAPPSAFATTTTASDTAPNAVFTNGAPTVSSNSLTSPAILLASQPAPAIVSFRHRWNFEGGTTLYDGGILEISSDGGATYANVSAIAGASFLEGGYTGPISAGFSSPIGGQQAWSTVQASYVTTRVQLPTSLNGSTIRLRFRAAWDSTMSNAGANWLIDTVRVQSGFSCASGAGICVLPDPLFSHGFEP